MSKVLSSISGYDMVRYDSTDLGSERFADVANQVSELMDLAETHRRQVTDFTNFDVEGMNALLESNGFVYCIERVEDGKVAATMSLDMFIDSRSTTKFAVPVALVKDFSIDVPLEARNNDPLGKYLYDVIIEDALDFPFYCWSCQTNQRKVNEGLSHPTSGELFYKHMHPADFVDKYPKFFQHEVYSDPDKMPGTGWYGAFYYNQLMEDLLEEYYSE